MSRELLRRALAALAESLDTVETEFAEDWRHGIPTREKQLDRMEGLIVEHKAVIDDIRAELEKPEHLDVGIVVEFAGIEGRYRLMAERLPDADH